MLAVSLPEFEDDISHNTGLTGLDISPETDHPAAISQESTANPAATNETVDVAPIVVSETETIDVQDDERIDTVESDASDTIEPSAGSADAPATAVTEIIVPQESATKATETPTMPEQPKTAKPAIANEETIVQASEATPVSIVSESKSMKTAEDASPAVAEAPRIEQSPVETSDATESAAMEKASESIHVGGAVSSKAIAAPNVAAISMEEIQPSEKSVSDRRISPPTDARQSAHNLEETSAARRSQIAAILPSRQSANNLEETSARDGKIASESDPPRPGSAKSELFEMPGFVGLYFSEYAGLCHALVREYPFVANLSREAVDQPSLETDRSMNSLEPGMALEDRVSHSIKRDDSRGILASALDDLGLDMALRYAVDFEHQFSKDHTKKGRFSKNIWDQAMDEIWGEDGFAS
jgi:hypothetical protein